MNVSGSRSACRIGPGPAPPFTAASDILLPPRLRAQTDEDSLGPPPVPARVDDSFGRLQPSQPSATESTGAGNGCQFTAHRDRVNASTKGSLPGPYRPGAPAGQER